MKTWCKKCRNFYRKISNFMKKWMQTAIWVHILFRFCEHIHNNIIQLPAFLCAHERKFIFYAALAPRYNFMSLIQLPFVCSHDYFIILSFYMARKVHKVVNYCVPIFPSFDAPPLWLVLRISLNLNKDDDDDGTKNKGLHVNKLCGKLKVRSINKKPHAS